MELIKGEFLKLKSKHLIIDIILISIIPILPCINAATQLDDINYANILSVIKTFSALTYLVFILPIFCIYMVVKLTKVENENNGWRMLMLLPVKKIKIYLAKYLVLIIMVVVSITSYIAAVYLSTICIGKAFVHDYTMLLYGAAIFITILPVTILLFIVARNFLSIVPVVLIGGVMTISNIFICQSKFWLCAPWTYPIVIANGSLDENKKVIVIGISALITAILLYIDYSNFSKKTIE